MDFRIGEVMLATAVGARSGRDSRRFLALEPDLDAVDGGVGG